MEANDSTGVANLYPIDMICRVFVETIRHCYIVLKTVDPIVYTCLKVQNFQNPELSKLQS